MKSPFPGMDPYLERHWLDVHTKLVTYAADALNEDLPGNLVARTEERIAIESESGLTADVAPDIRILEMVERDPTAAGGLALAAPYRLVALVEPVTERFVRILDDSGQIVSVIEFISPSNKRGKGLEAFRQKRAELLRGGVHFMEIDLVRAGDWPALLAPHVCPRKLATTYRALVRLAHEPAAAYLYPIPIRNPLPPVPVPLRPGDPRVEIDLQALIERVYRNGRYGRTLNYAEPCDPPLQESDAAWAGELLRGGSRD